MKVTQSEHARKVVDSFKSMIPDHAKNALTDDHYEELALLVEAAIDSSLLQQATEASSIVKEAAEKIHQLSE